MLLQIYEFRKNNLREGLSFLWVKLNYINAWTVKPYGIYKLKDTFCIFVHYVTEYTIRNDV
jgi:hypothetical protein